MNKNLVFVYSTLKKGFHNNVYLDGSVFICTGMLEGYRMFKIDTFPGIIQGSGTIYGELYQVPNISLNHLDILEAEGRLFKRIKEKIMTKYGGICEANVYVYLHQVDEKDMIASGEWKSNC